MAAPKAIQNAVLGAAIIVELIVLAGHPLFGWGPDHHRFAATPPTLDVAPPSPQTASSVLLGLAGDAAATARHTPTARGRYAYVLRGTWQLADQRGPGRRPRRPLTSTITTWRTPDGHGHAIIRRATRGGGTQTLGVSLAGPPLVSLTGAPALLDRRLGLAPGASTIAAISAFATLASRQPIPPAAEAEILRQLAGDAGLVNGGSTRDRAGRPGIAIDYSAAIRGLTVRDTLVLSPATGALEEFDQALAGPAHHLDVPAGALLADTVYLRSGQVAALDSVP